MKKLSNKGKSVLRILLILVGIVLLLWYLAPIPVVLMQETVSESFFRLF